MRKLSIFWLLLALSAPSYAPLWADPIDYTTAERRVDTTGAPLDNRVLRIALGFGRSSGEFNEKETKEIYEALDNGKPVPAKYDEKWQRLVRIAQVQTYIENQPNFFPVGYEFEVAHEKLGGYSDWDKGYQALTKLIGQHFGVKSSKDEDVWSKDGQTHVDFKAVIKDDQGREWPLVTEYVRRLPKNDKKNYLNIGWEQVTPPLRRAEDLQQLSALRIHLGRSPFGLSNGMTGLHQTNSLVPSAADATDKNFLGRVAANRLLLQAQFAPAVFETLDVRRGGAHTNMFMRPVVLDHYEMLQDIAHSDASRFDLDYLKYLMKEKYIEKELEVQLMKDELATPEQLEAMKSWTIEQKKKYVEEKYHVDWKSYKPSWKYRDGQLKFLDNIPEKVLWELRVGDYDMDRPETTMKQSLLDQLFDQAAYKAAKEGKILSIDIPPRPPGMSDDDYWALLKKNQKASVEEMFKVLGVTDQNLINLMTDKSFKAREPKPQVHAKAWAFEGEAKSEDLVKFILPRDPKLRSEWRKMSKSERIKKMEKMGFAHDGKYTPDKYRILATEFYADIDKYPFLHPDVHLEASGNWEIKSNPRAFKTKDEMVKAAAKIREEMTDWIAFHAHEFVPDQELAHIRGNLADEFAKNLERRSLGMLVEGFVEADPKGDYGTRYLDTWSLDRYSPGDIAQVRDHLNGATRLSSSDQKYHNFAFRPVNGGLDFEARDLESSIESGNRHLSSLDASITHSDFGDPAWKNDPPLFNEFRDHENLDDVKRFTLEDAVGKKHPLTDLEKSLLHKFQFEAYRPVMGPWMAFGEEHWGLNEAPAELLSIKDARGNFENNLALPLLNYDEQSWLSAADKAKLQAERDKFLERVYAILQKIQKDPKYKFLQEHDNFMHLAEYMRRSTHPSRPNVDLLPKNISMQQRELLRGLTDDLRAEVVRWAKATRIDRMVNKSLPTEKEVLARKAETAAKRQELAAAEAAKKPAEVQSPGPGEQPRVAASESQVAHAATAASCEAQYKERIRVQAPTRRIRGPASVDMPGY